MKICIKKKLDYMRFLALKLGDNLTWYGMLWMLDAVFNYSNECFFVYSGNYLNIFI